MKRALITGIFGQDGSYLAELLAGKHYEVHGIVRQELSPQSTALRMHLSRRGLTPILHECDLSSFSKVRDLMKTVQPDECYHLAAVHHSAQNVYAAVEHDRYLLEQNILSVLHILHAIREVSATTRLVFAGSCLIYEDSGISPQCESTPFRSRSVYATSKIVGLQVAELFRKLHRLHTSTAILYNHESPRREAQFVSQKIVKGLVSIKRGETERLELGNLDDIKDWGYARDYVHGMWLMAQANSPADYILATGTGHTVADFVKAAADSLELPNWSEVVTIQPGLTRPVTKTRLVGNPQRARTELGWTHSLDFGGLVDLLVRHELEGTLD
jgi:GDPmannose 4,6-dehydratase